MKIIPTSKINIYIQRHINNGNFCDRGTSYFSTAFAPRSHARFINFTNSLTKDSYNTGNFMPYSFRLVCGFFNVPHYTYKHVGYL